MKLIQLLLLGGAMFSSGCASIHSPSVRSLISQEGAKIQEASSAAGDFANNVKNGTDALTKGLSELNTSIAQNRESEHVHTIVFGAHQNLESKTGIDAYAAGYLIAITYLAEQAGLDQEVNDQFAKNTAALQEQAKRISDSWKSLAALQAQVQAYAKKSAISSLDADAIAAVITQIPGGSQAFATILADAEKVNTELGKVLNLSPLSSGSAAQARPYAAEIMDLLERIKPGKQQ